MSKGTLSLLYAVKGYKAPTMHFFTVSLFSYSLIEPLCTNNQSALSSLFDQDSSL